MTNNKFAQALEWPAHTAEEGKRRSAWVQLAGHRDTFLLGGPHTIWKKTPLEGPSESNTYRALMTEGVMCPVIPRMYRQVVFQKACFIELDDLLQGFKEPNVMDIKIGTRTFLESEVSRMSGREDLYQKMIAVDSQAPTIKEHSLKQITKLRYMQFREQQSSTSTLGFRMEAVRMSGQEPMCNLQKVRDSRDVYRHLASFLDDREDVRQRLLCRLKVIRQCFEASKFLKMHEIIGSSLLLMYDSSGEAGAWMIDFGKTVRIPSHIHSITHRTSWKMRNHEDGYLLGLDNLIQMMESISWDSFELTEDSVSSEEQTDSCASSEDSLNFLSRSDSAIASQPSLPGT